MSHVAIGPRVWNLLKEAFPDMSGDRSELTETIAVASLDEGTYVSVEYPERGQGRGTVVTDNVTLIDMPLDPTNWSDYVGFVSLAKKTSDEAFEAMLHYWETLADIRNRIKAEVAT